MDARLKKLIELVEIIALGFILSFVIRTFLLDPRIVPTGSMLPTIRLQDRLLVDKLMFKFNGIERGDIVVFRAPPESGEKDDLIKRVIGLPGETIQVKDGKVLINGAALEEDYLLDKPDYQYDPVTVPEDSYFVLGDNRRGSNDSHIWGFVPMQNIKGKVWIRYSPSNRFGKLDK
ncbi:signal peptidase I [Desulfosporosinus sp.]|uniref:signal peptidase I n=1 Tax=Desulfosporosinus sp. TaxID=157907 RepID=UPI0025B9A89F|nr:signal peptidase I [Desulfosporosinus sp.]MBC2721321.1 signal peptidase I [Desulfosporosinus sp.]MBC2728825.1 signal peptidase I [Desulfosporosinus sp.]